MNSQLRMSIKDFVSEERKEDIPLQASVDLRWLRKGIAIIIIVGGVLLLPIKVS